MNVVEEICNCKYDCNCKKIITDDSDLPIIENDATDYIKNELNVCYHNVFDDPWDVTVKFITIENDVYTQAFPEEITITELKSLLMIIFHVPDSIIMLKHKGVEILDEQILKDFDIDIYGILELEILSTNIHYEISVAYAYRDFTVPDVITVRVQTLDRGIEDIVVEIYNRCIIKPFLGGYIDKNTGIEYHHGYSQTGPPKPKVPPEMKNHRDTQTYLVRNRKLDIEYAHATQMTNEDIWIPNVTDRILTAGPYETADEREKRIDVEGKVRTIQRYYRIWKLKKMLKILSEEYHKRLRIELERETFEFNEDLKRKKKDLISKVFPQSPADFAMLHAMTDRWKNAEIKRISQMTCGASKIAEFYLLLDKEIEILKSIETLYQKLENDKKIQNDMRFFKIIGDPVKWISDYKNLHISMDTLETQQGRRYHALFQSIADKTIDKTSRIEALLNVKQTVIGDNCAVSNELTTLIDRSCELLARGFSNKQLEALEKRIEVLLLIHFNLEDCNEHVTDRHKHDQEKYMKNNLFYCKRCQKLKTIDSFVFNARTSNVQLCTTCKSIDKAYEPWIDLSPYAYILKQIRRYERLHKAHSSVAFILQDIDIYHLVTQVWHSHSAISECNDIYKLCLCRWLKHEDWAPWNCILLTVEEAKAHLKNVHIEDSYEQQFINDIFNKHALAKKIFVHAIILDRGQFPDCPPKKDPPEICWCG